VKRRILVVIACMSIISLVGSSVLEAGELLWRFRGLYISPNEDGDTILGSGSEVGVDSAFGPEIDFTWKMTPHWGLELIIGGAEHEFTAEGGALDGIDLGRAWVIPPTLTLQYHFVPNKKARPYVGIGFNATTFQKYRYSQDLKDLGIDELVLKDSVGYAAQLGIDIDVSENWFLNIDAKYIRMSTEVKIRQAAVPNDVLQILSLDIDPFVIGFGFGSRF
jgi:outer membrane protein